MDAYGTAAYRGLSWISRTLYRLAGLTQRTIGAMLLPPLQAVWLLCAWTLVNRARGIIWNEPMSEKA